MIDGFKNGAPINLQDPDKVTIFDLRQQVTRQAEEIDRQTKEIETIQKKLRDVTVCAERLERKLNSALSLVAVLRE